MTDVADFAEDGFDPISWINQACESRPAEEPLEKFLAELEMRLQLSAEDIEATLSDSSAQAMRRIPFAIQEIYRLQGDIQGMQDQVQIMAQTVQRDAEEARGSVAHISELHRVKANMESACNSLKEATELSGLFVKVEEVFAAGDLPKVAEILASMRRSLSLVGDVPEFRAGRQKLRALEDRLQMQVEGSLGDALARGSDDANTRKLCGLLLAVDRYGTIESLYVSTKLAQVHALWEEHAAAGGGAEVVAAWLPSFLSRLLALLQAEAAWGAGVLPGQAAVLLGALSLGVFGKISKAVRDRLAPLRSIAPLSVLARELGVFGRGLHELLREVDAGRRREIIQLVYGPLEDKVTAYGELEAAQLEDDLRTALQPSPAPPPGSAGAAVEEPEAAVSRLASSIRPAFAALHAAVERCNALTGGSEVRALLKAVDSELTSYLTSMQSVVSGISSRQKSRAAGQDVEDIATVLQLIRVGRELSRAVGRLEAALRTAVGTAVGRLQALTGAAAAVAPSAGAAGAATAGVTPFSTASVSPGPGNDQACLLSGEAEADPVALRLVANRGERLAKLGKLGTSLSDPRFLLLPSAVSQLDIFSSTVQSTVFDVLLARVASLLAPLPSLPEWRKAAASDPAAAAAPLPSFNTYPLPYVTAIGDHLMAMPQQLEVLMGGTSEEAVAAAAAASGSTADAVGVANDPSAEWEELAAEWLDKAVSGAGGMYADAIFKIPILTEQGGCQLATDVEYFVNVMGALHVAPPPSLLTVQLLAGAASEEFGELAQGAMAEGAADVPALKALAAMRNLQLEAPAA
ncbi:hypothetical protein Vretimale_16532 [Volvox reticuliferus]|uniref:Conserved oligomeric Golgi complex subunit 7 n=1 Tax=Volvox reticuliferus TaxID=1737510 RepID=A0A8J4CCZ8_9CHLO|nr:hypothetical protein Vretifemale_8722 [Volvox reticuliferus]GIM13378.1 hypothetical protein Vretimale_16532 [Volvox reticuliferus]